MKRMPFNMYFSNKQQRRIFIAFCLIGLIALLGIGARVISYVRLYYATEQLAVLNVATIKATRGPMNEEIILPGNVLAWHEAPIYSRTNGYVINWLVDIGAHVKNGDLLAEISTPEVNDQLKQTEADLEKAKADEKIALITAARWKNLLKTDSVSKQETDEKISDAEAKTAIVAAMRANLERLRDLVKFERIVAPFDGVITSRTTDIGRLINAGSGSNIPLFRIAQTNRLRIYVRVPEYYSSRITTDLIAELHFTEHPDKTYPAKLLDTAKAIDQQSRTLLIQLEAENNNNELLAGSYTEVHLKIPASATSVRLPVNTLIFRSKGLQVATIDGDSKAELKNITLGRDFGDTVEVVAGLEPGQQVILNPPDSLMTGQKVRIVTDSALREAMLQPIKKYSVKRLMSRLA